MSTPSLRSAAGLFRLAGFLLCAWPSLWWLDLFAGGGKTARRARWLQILSRRALRILGCRVEFAGRIPRGGLVLSNHLGYIDILALGSIMPAVFVAKQDVRAWPAFGAIAAAGGTVFLDRDSPGRVREALSEMEDPIRAGVPVVIFPEGTSTDGSQVLPFRSPLLAAAEKLACPVTPAAIRYLDPYGRPNRRLAYHGEDVFLPHLLSALAAGPAVIKISFGEPLACRNRKELARRLHAEISAKLRSPEDGMPLPRASAHTSGGIPPL